MDKRGSDMAKLKAVLELLIEGALCRSSSKITRSAVISRAAAIAILSRIGC